MMKEFDDNMPARSFDNFQFVKFTEIMSKNMPQYKKKAAFVLAALMEIAAQYKATLELWILGCLFAKSPESIPLPPPAVGGQSSSVGLVASVVLNFETCPICRSAIHTRIKLY